jgi:flagellar biosynthesis/type III secretory pathway M-ring protein FliF/YscJ
MWLLPGEIKRLGVGVLVSDEVEADTLTALSEAIKAAAGIDEKRGDYLAVVPMAFGGGEIPPLPATEKYEFYKRLARYGLTFLSVLIALAMMRSVLLSFRPQSGLPADAEALAGEQLLLLPESPPLEPAEPGVTRGPPSTQLKQAFRQASEVRSDDVADILRIWLREDSG